MTTSTKWIICILAGLAVLLSCLGLLYVTSHHSTKTLTPVATTSLQTTMVSDTLSRTTTLGTPDGSRVDDEERDYEFDYDLSTGNSADQALTMIAPELWQERSDVLIAKSESGSFGASLSEYQQFLMVGAPLDQTFGRVFVFQKSVSQGLRQAHVIPFGHSGSAYQKAGATIQQNMICAPDYASQPRSRKAEGAVFTLSDLDQPHYSLTRQSFDLHDEFIIQKSGQGMCYCPPFMLVAKEKQSQCRVDVFKYDSEWRLLQKLEAPSSVAESQKLFGYSMVSTSSWIAITNPVLNECYLYTWDTAHTKLVYVQTLDWTEQWNDDLIDLHQEIRVCRESARTLVVFSRDHRALLTFQWDDTARRMSFYAKLDNLPVYELCLHPRSPLMAAAIEGGPILFFDLSAPRPRLLARWAAASTLTHVKMIWNQGKTTSHLFVYGDDGTDHHLYWLTSAETCLVSV